MISALNGLMLSSGVRINGIDLARPGRVIVVENAEFTARAKVITVQGEPVQDGVKRYRREAPEHDRPIRVTRFDGEGLISKEYARLVDRKYCGRHNHHSFQVRMPYIKGMLHEVDFKDFLRSAGCTFLTDIWGRRHPVENADIILTQSMVKCLGWMRENGLTWAGYWEKFQKYDHALCITNVGKPKPDRYTELNYQFLNTLSMTEEEFRPADLPLGWDHSPAEDPRLWITMATEQRYYDLCADPDFRLSVFTKERDAKARGYMFKTGTPDIMCARCALLAWCSIPESKKAGPREEWQFGCCFPELHEGFPELVDDVGRGWLYRHVHGMAAFVRAEPERVSAHARKHCEMLAHSFDAGWRSRARQFQGPLFSSAAYSWLLSFDSILADALEQGPLCAREYRFTEEQAENIQKTTPPGVPVDAARALVAYYHLNKPEDSNWVVLPVINFDGWFGTTSFSRRWLPALDGTVIRRDAQNYGICRYKSLI